MALNDYQIRPALPADGPRLTEIAHAAKRAWGYTDEEIKSWRAELTVTADMIGQRQMFVALHADHIIGWVGTASEGDVRELIDLWVEPEHMGRHVGRMLFEYAKADAKATGALRLHWESDPHAERFYVRMGAKRTGSIRSNISGRKLPTMTIDL